MYMFIAIRTNRGQRGCGATSGVSITADDNVNLQVAKVQQMSAMRSRLERDFLDSLPGKSVLQLREHLTAKLAALREQTAAVMSERPAEEVSSLQYV